MRNNLKKHNFKHGEHTIDWWHIVNFYNFDKENDIRLAPKLTDDHICLPMFTKMRVRLAAQIFSHTVAAGIATLNRLGKLPVESKSTAYFVDFMDKLFNCFNSSSRKSCKPLGQALSDHSGHVKFLQEAFEYLAEFKLPNNKSLPCINGWQISIKSLLSLWSDFRSSYAFEFLLTNRLNQDCLENLFSIIRGKGGKRENPDAREFRAAYRQVVFDQILLPSPGSNCEIDRDGILLSLTNITMSNNSSSTTVSRAGRSDVQTDQNFTDVDSLMKMTAPVSLPVENVEAFMAGYLVRKSKITDCSGCKEILVQKDTPDLEMCTFLRGKKRTKNRELWYIQKKLLSTLLENGN